MFRVVAIALIVGLLFKDLAFVGDRYVIRTIVELTSLLVGAYWLMTHASIPLLRRQSLLIVYLSVLLLSAFVSSDPFFVILQIATLAAVVVFSFAYFAEDDVGAAITPVLVAALAAYGLVLAGSLFYAQFAPTLAFEYGWGDAQARFHGLFGEPAELGMVAGLTIGLACFLRTSWLLRLPALGVALVCVYLTFSRTFWVAVVVSVVATLWIYKPKVRVPMVIAAALVAAALVGNVDTIVKSNERLLRADSLTNLSGRTEIWEAALDAFKERPVLGYGFTLGADGIVNSRWIKGLSHSDQVVKTPTLHNGYVQALLDSGALGLALYCSIIVGALVRLWRKDAAKQYAPVMYVLVFSMIGNVGETYIFGAAQSHQALYWMLAVLALGLEPAVSGRRESGQGARTLQPKIRLAPRPTHATLRNYARRAGQ
jgi:O-antigen ligase